jgi:succinate dehydrogenase / fumarate reductase cytochrome b subunit
MSTLTQSFSYSIGKKLLMGLTGLFLVLFLVVHLVGNLLLLVGPEAFNDYAEFMGTNLLIRISEIGLFAIFIVHIVDGLMISAKNAKARPVKYAVKAGGANSTWFSRNMKWTGLFFLVFLIIHLCSFFLTSRFGVDIGVGISEEYNYLQPGMETLSAEPISLWHKTAAQFTVEWYVAINVAAMVFLIFHLNHGFQSAFQTLGWNHKKYTPIIKLVGTGFSILVPIAFAAIPVYFVVMKHMGNLLPYFTAPSFGITH